MSLNVRFVFQLAYIRSFLSLAAENLPLYVATAFCYRKIAKDHSWGLQCNSETNGTKSFDMNLFPLENSLCCYRIVENFMIYKLSEERLKVEKMFNRKILKLYFLLLPFIDKREWIYTFTECEFVDNWIKTTWKALKAYAYVLLQSKQQTWQIESERILLGKNV